MLQVTKMPIRAQTAGRTPRPYPLALLPGICPATGGQFAAFMQLSLQVNVPPVHGSCFRPQTVHTANVLSKFLFVFSCKIKRVLNQGRKEVMQERFWYLGVKN